MRKKVLLAEQSDAIRSIAESILHQNGYDVITADSADKAKEYIITAQPNILIIGADLKDSNGNFLYDTLDTSETTSRIPLLLIEDPNGRELPYPPEVVLPRPFDPKEFLERVTLFVGGGDSKPKDSVETVDPFTGASVDDEFLDTALGIDSIEVEDSEVMDKTWITSKLRIPPKSGTGDAHDLIQSENGSADDMTNTHRKVETLMIRDSEDKPAAEDSTPPKPVSESSKIQLSSDQYGLAEQEESLPSETQTPAEKDHDYDWFLKEIQKDNADTSKPPADTSKKNDSGIIKTPTSDSLEQVKTPASPPEIMPGGVDHFISEFKKEAEQISAELASPVTEEQLKADFESEISDDEVAPPKIHDRTEVNAPVSEPEIMAEVTPPAQKAEDSTPASSVDPEEVHHMCTYLAELLAEKLAKKIADRIDPEELYNMIKDDLPRLIAGEK